jgi:hypothetical protein
VTRSHAIASRAHDAFLTAQADLEIKETELRTMVERARASLVGSTTMLRFAQDLTGWTRWVRSQQAIFTEAARRYAAPTAGAIAHLNQWEKWFRQMSPVGKGKTLDREEARCRLCLAIYQKTGILIEPNELLRLADAAAHAAGDAIHDQNLFLDHLIFPPFLPELAPSAKERERTWWRSVLTRRNPENRKIALLRQVIRRHVVNSTNGYVSEDGTAAGPALLLGVALLHRLLEVETTPTAVRKVWHEPHTQTVEIGNSES